MDKIAQLKTRFDGLVKEREAARKRISPDVEGSSDEYRRLQQKVNEAYRELMDARHNAGEGMLD